MFVLRSASRISPFDRRMTFPFCMFFCEISSTLFMNEGPSATKKRSRPLCKKFAPKLPALLHTNKHSPIFVLLTPRTMYHAFPIPLPWALQRDPQLTNHASGSPCAPPCGSPAHSSSMSRKNDSPTARESSARVLRARRCSLSGAGAGGRRGSWSNPNTHNHRLGP